MAANVSTKLKMCLHMIYWTRSNSNSYPNPLLYTQHLGHFLLTNLLLPKLRETALKEQSPSRVITVSSSLYHNARRSKTEDDSKLEPGIDLSDLMCQRRKYSLFEQYAQSKLANILFSIELGRREMDIGKCLSLLTEPAMKKKKKEKKIRPRLTPVETVPPMDDVDDLDLGFSDVASTPISKQKGSHRKLLTPRGDEKKDTELDTIVTPSPPKRRSRPKLTPVSSAEIQGEEEDDDDPFGFHDVVVSTPPTPKRKVSSKPVPHQSMDRCKTCLVKSLCLHPGLVRTNVV